MVTKAKTRPTTPMPRESSSEIDWDLMDELDEQEGEGVPPMMDADWTPQGKTPGRANPLLPPPLDKKG